MAKTTEQVLADHPYMAYFIDECNEVKRWSAKGGPGTLEIEVYDASEE